MTSRIIAVTSWSVLTVYFWYLWKTSIWPTIRVPYAIRDEEWVPIHTSLLSVPEMSQYLAEFTVMCRLYLQALYNLRNRRRTAFLVLVLSCCSLMFVIGYYISGFTLSYIFVISILIWPCVIYHKILPRVYMKIEPHLMALQYKLMSRLKTSKLQKTRPDQPGDSVETDDEDEMLPAIDPELSAAIARTITDSEDESGGGGSPHSRTREPSLGYNSDLDNLEEEAGAPDYHLEDESAMFDIEPDVSLMPDFEKICEYSNTFMLDTAVMPGLDDIDRSRIGTAVPHKFGAGTDSETESLPYDDELPPSQPQARLAPESQRTVAAPPTVSQVATESHSPEPTNQSLMAVVPGLMGAFVQGVIQASQVARPDDELRLDPRDRIADASAAGDDSDSDLDFEFVSKEEFEHYANS